jgi:hypothetical protein
LAASVLALPSGKIIGAVAAIEGVRATAAEEPIVALLAVDLVVPIVALHLVLALQFVEDVVPGSPRMTSLPVYP